MIGDDSRLSSSVNSSGTIDLGNASIFESYPFENDSYYLELPESDKEIMKQFFRNYNPQHRWGLHSVESRASMDSQALANQGS